MQKMIRAASGLLALTLLASSTTAAAPAHDMSTMAVPLSAPAKSGDPNTWAELNAFHDVLQAAWHPVANGDLKPARASGAQLLAAALVWRKSRGPAKCDNAALRAGMAEFIADARSYADAVKRDASDDAVTVTLRRTHADFEAIAEPCMAGAMGEMKGMKKP